jgi:hypothetical protein
VTTSGNATALTGFQAAAAVPSDAADAADVATAESVDANPDSAPLIADDVAESAFRAEARERGEAVVPKPAADVPDEAEKKPLPPLNDLVNRIPPEVRETLDELFRAKFITVRRVPRNALKS